MNAEVKALVLTELRSGQYEKGDGCPKIEYPNGRVCHCTLGIIAELAVKHGVEQVFGTPWTRQGTGITYHCFEGDRASGGSERSSYEILSKSTRAWAGLDGWQCKDIAKRNDNMCSFEQVAEYIERVF